MMTRLNLILFGILILTALGVVTSQDRARKLYFELQQQQDAVKQYDIEWGQLQLEQSTWAAHARIEQIATEQLHMQVPDAKRIQMVLPAKTTSAEPHATQPLNAQALDGKAKSGDNSDSATVHHSDMGKATP